MLLPKQIFLIIVTSSWMSGYSGRLFLKVPPTIQPISAIHSTSLFCAPSTPYTSRYCTYHTLSKLLLYSLITPSAWEILKIMISLIYLCSHSISCKSVMVLMDTQYIFVNFQNWTAISKVMKKEFTRKVMFASS